MKILIHSNGPANGTGYGQQVAQLAPRLVAAGHDVAISCMTGVSGRPSEWEGIMCLSAGMQPFSTDVLGHHARHFFGRQPGLVLTLFDAWCMDPMATSGLATAIWTPVHSVPMSVGDKAYFSAAQVLPIAMSRFGEKQMRVQGLDPRYAPHGIDCATFRPLDAAERSAVRKSLNIPDDCFLVTMVAANKGTGPSRKAFAESFQAFAKFRKRHPDARLYLHTLMSKAGYGLSLVPLLSHLGIQDAVHFSDQYGYATGLFAPDFVAAVLGASDVFLNPSMGEGFGLPAVEAQACGIPVIAGDNSAQRELLGSGWLTECQPFWHHDDEADWHLPLIRSITTNLAKAHKHARDRDVRQRAREFAERYDADLVFAEHWKPLLDMLEMYAGARRVSLPRAGEITLPVREYDGAKWIFRGGHTDDWITQGHEDNLAPVLDDMLPDGGTFLDVGAHVGRWSLHLARRAGEVIAVEANPDTAAVLEAHVALNKLRNVRVINAAAWDGEAQLALDDPNKKITGGSTRVVEADDGTVTALRVDDMLPEGKPGTPGRVDLVKLDVEGADLRALRGMAGTLARYRPKLLVERHDIYGYYDLADLTALLGELGYAHREVNILIGGGTSIAPYLACEPVAPAADEEG